jgi:regulator of replication initiation timing
VPPIFQELFHQIGSIEESLKTLAQEVEEMKRGGSSQNLSVTRTDLPD